MMRYILLLIIVLLLPLSSRADIGRVTELSGNAVIKRNSGSIIVSKGTLVEINDRVETKNGRVKITFNDDTVVTVTESSSLLIDDFVYSPSSKSGKLSLKTAMGTVRYVSGNIAHSNPNSVKINTPTAAIAVRGTDFTMSVAESGASMIILLPACEVDQSVDLRGLTCGSGKIEVDSGGKIVVLDKPYMATMVETAGFAPSQPVIVNLGGQTVGNNLMISPPKTSSGASVVAAAKTANEKTIDVKVTAAGVVETPKTAAKQSDDQPKSETTTVVTTVSIDTETTTMPKESVLSIVEDSASTTTVEDQSFYKIWAVGNPTKQVGWGYEKISKTGHNYVNIVLPVDTKASIIVTQDQVTDTFTPNSSFGKNYGGTIIINQAYR